MKPILIDAFCGGGGATRGYQDAGFYVIGVDIKPQPNYCGDRFIQADALEYLKSSWLYDAVHASPPCQRHSRMSNCRPGLAEKYPALIEPTRELLQKTGLPYVIENVEGSPLHDPITLCGQMFGLDLYRHRLFESNMPLQAPPHPTHIIPASKAGHWRPGTIMSVSGHVSPIAEAKRAMGISWMTRDELAESIPPAFTEHIARQLLQALEMAA